MCTFFPAWLGRTLAWIITWPKMPVPPLKPGESWSGRAREVKAWTQGTCRGGQTSRGERGIMSPHWGVGGSDEGVGAASDGVGLGGDRVVGSPLSGPAG